MTTEDASKLSVNDLCDKIERHRKEQADIYSAYKRAADLDPAMVASKDMEARTRRVLALKIGVSW